MNPPDGNEPRHCRKCSSSYPPDTKVCVTCGLWLDTEESVVPGEEPQEEPSAPDEVISDRLFDWRLTPGRATSLLVWAGWAAFGVWRFLDLGSSSWRVLLLPVFMIFPLVPIWFPDTFVGMSPAQMVAGYPERSWLVPLCGWVLLLGPIPFFLWLLSL